MFSLIDKEVDTLDTFVEDTFIEAFGPIYGEFGETLEAVAVRIDGK